MPSYPAFRTKPYYNELRNFLAASIDLATGELLDSAVRPVVVSELADSQTVVDAAAAAAPDAVAAELAATDFGPYVGPEVDAHIAADPGFTAAAETAVDNEIIGRDLLEGAAIIEDDIAFAVVDEDGRRTWLEAGMDGGLTAHSVDKIGEHISGATDADMTADGLAFAVVDENDRRTWIEADAEGKPTARTLQLLGLQADAGSASGSIVAYGDSMTAGATVTTAQSYPAVLAALTGRDVSNQGAGGDASIGIAARQGGQPYLLLPAGGAFPASGSVAVDIQQPAGTTVGTVLPEGIEYAGDLRAYGVDGVLERGPSSTYTFTRDTAGDALTVNQPVAFYFAGTDQYRSRIHVYWSGNNNAEDPDQVIADLHAMIQYQTSDRFLVIGVITNSGYLAGSPRFDGMLAINEEWAATYGRRFIDIRRYLVDYGLADAGITPTAQDTTDMANGIVPESLRNDTIHFTATGYALVAQQVYRRLTELEMI